MEKNAYWAKRKALKNDRVKLKAIENAYRVKLKALKT